MRKISLLLLILGTLFTPNKKASAHPLKTPMQLNAKEFKMPGTDMRPIYFFSLNDRLDAAGMDAKMKAFKEAGAGGAFLHARIGLLTPFLEKEWWEAIDAGVKAAEKYGLQAWFYDEDKWPSGFAGGKVPLLNRDFLAQCILRVPKKAKLPKDAKIVCETDSFVWFHNMSRWGDGRFNGTGYVDLLNPEVIKSFIEIAYKPYVERYGKQLGKVAWGMFTDEPQIQPRPSVGFTGAYTYSPVLPAAFQQMNGYDFFSILPIMHTRKPGCEKARIDYYRTVSHLFEQSFSKQLGDYCQANNMPFTGHLMGEDTPSKVAHYCGSNMQNYRHMQIPGIDQLRLAYISPYTPRCMTSVANQYGKERRLSEGYGISGQNMNFEDRKWLLDWHTLYGINLITPHLTAYSIKGERKRDYPPTFSEHQPYWKFNSIIDDYTARMCYATSVGKYAARLGVLNAIETGWIDVNMGALNLKDEISVSTEAFLTRLQGTHFDYDMVDEQIASEIAKVNSSGLQVGAMNYSCIVLPYMKTIRKSTIDLLEELNKKGGKILCVGSFPYLVDGLPQTRELARLKAFTIPVTLDDLKSALIQHCPREFEIIADPADQIWVHSRITDLGKGRLFQLTNTSRLKEIQATLKFSTPQQNVAVWNPVSGESYALKAKPDGGYALPFAQAQTWIVTTGAASAQANLKASFQPLPFAYEVVQTLDAPWKGKRVDPNSITLDFAAYSLDGGANYSDPEPVLGIYHRLRQQKKSGKLLLKYFLDVDQIPSRCAVAVEQAKMYESVRVNGGKVMFGEEFFVDPVFLKADIQGNLVRGRNEIVLTLDFKAPIDSSLDNVERYGSEIEAIYIVGEFGVSAVAADQPIANTARNKTGYMIPMPIYSFKAFRMTGEQTEFSGNLSEQGYPFYAGQFQLSQSFNLAKKEAGKRYFLRFPKHEAIVLEAEINGNKSAPMVFHPYEIEVTSWIKTGKNQLRLTLTNSLRNLLGPHHNPDGEMVAVGPTNFYGKREKGKPAWYDARLTGKVSGWSDDYYMISFGLLESPQLIVR